MLLLCLTLTAHFLSGGAPVAISGRTRTFGALLALLVLMIGVGKTGAIAALGDTLYPVDVAAGRAQGGPRADEHAAPPAAHPAPGARRRGRAPCSSSAPRPFRWRPRDRRGRLARRAVVVLAIGQVVLGFVNVWLLAPVWMQLAHLLVADLLWIALVVRDRLGPRQAGRAAVTSG